MKKEQIEQMMNTLIANGKPFVMGKSMGQPKLRTIGYTNKKTNKPDEFSFFESGLMIDGEETKVIQLKEPLSREKNETKENASRPNHKGKTILVVINGLIEKNGVVQANVESIAVQD